MSETTTITTTTEAVTAAKKTPVAVTENKTPSGSEKVVEPGLMADDPYADAVVVSVERYVKPCELEPPYDPNKVEVPWYHDKNMRNLVIQTTITVLFCLLEIIAGIIIKSLAVLSDAFHMVSDSIALVVAIIALKVAKRERTVSMTYGWRRAEVIGGIVNGVFLMSATLFIVLEAVQRFMEVEEITEPIAMIVVGVAGLLVNLIGMVMFHGHAGHMHSHGHGHGHSHETTAAATVAAEAEGADSDSSCDSEHDHDHDHKHDHKHDHDHDKKDKKEKKKGPVSLNLHGVFLHLMGDALGSVVATVVGVCILLCNGQWKYYLDPILSLVIAVVIMCSAVPLVKSCVRILMQSVPDGVDLNVILKELESVEGAESIHDLHVWQLSTEKHVGTVHIACEKGTDFMKLAQRVKHVLHNHNIHATTIQPEFISENDRENDLSECMLPCERDNEDTGLLDGKSHGHGHGHHHH